MNYRVILFLCLGIWTLTCKAQDTFIGLRAGQVNSIHFGEPGVKPYSPSVQLAADFRVFGRFLGFSVTNFNYEMDFPDGSSIRTLNSALFKINVGRSYRIFKEKRLQYITVSSFFSTSTSSRLIKAFPSGNQRSVTFNYFLVGIDASYQWYFTDKLAIESAIGYSFPTFPVFQKFGVMDSRIKSLHLSFSIFYSIFKQKSNEKLTN